MNRNLSHLVKDIIRQQGLRVSPISNLYGVPIVYPDVPSTPTLNGSWVMHYLDSMAMFSPDEIISKLSSITIHAAPVVVSNSGNLTFNSLEGTTMLSTTIDAVTAISVNVIAQCMGKQIRLYVGESLVRGAANAINIPITVPKGKTEIHVVFYGAGTTPATLNLPADVNFSVGNIAPPAPRWLNSGSVNSHYLDPKTGSTGVSISWYNQENVGGWGVYVVTSTAYGIAGSILPASNNYIIKTNYSGVAPFDASVVTINSIPIGAIEKSYYDDSTKSLVLLVSAYYDTTDFTTIVSGTLNVLAYKMIASIDRTSNDPTVTFVDLNVQSGNTYSYCLDSYSSFESDIRSNKSIILNVNAGDVTPPGNVIITSASLQGTLLTLNYFTPSDPDYYLTNAIYYYQGSGTGFIANALLASNAGNPSTANSVSIDISQLVSGTIYLTTTDVLGNSQYVLSGTPYFFNTNGFIKYTGPLLWLFGGPTGAIMSGTLDMAQHQIIHIGTGNTLFTASGQLEVDIPTGTPPLVIASTTKVANLNVDFLNGLNSAAYGQIAANQTWTGSNNFTGAPSTSILTVQDNVTGGTLSLGSDGVGQTHITWGGSGHIDGQGAQLEIWGTAGNGVGIYSLASNSAVISLLANGQIGMNTNSPKSVFHVVTSGNGGFASYAVIQSDPGVAYGGGLLITNNTSQNAGAGSWKMTSTFDNVVGRARWGWIYNTAPETFINSGAVFEIGPNGGIGWVGTAFNTTMLQNYSGPMITLNGVGQRFATFDAQSNSLSTTSSDVIVLRGGTQAAAYTTGEARALHIFDAVKGAGSTITTQVGIRVDNQTQGGTNYAIITGTGQVQFGDQLQVTNNLTVTSAGAASIDLSGGAGNIRDFVFQTTATPRWVFRANATAETGSDAGSDFQIIARHDDGTVLDNTITITRAAGGTMTINRPVSMSNQVITNIGNAGTDFLANGGLTLANDLTVNALGTFDSTASPTKDYLLGYNGTKWIPRLVQLGFNSGQVTSSSTGSGFNGDNSQTAIVNTVPNPTGTPTAMSGAAPVLTPIYNGMIIDLSASYPAGLMPGFIFVVDYSISSGTTWTNGAMKSSATKLVHAGLNQAWGYEYRYVVSGSASTGNSPASPITQPSAKSETNAYGLIVASQIATINLSSISANIGDISAGQLRNSINTAGILFSNNIPSTWTQGIFFAGANPPAGTVTGMYIDFTATGNRPILHHTGLNLNADGSAVFSGTIFGSTLNINGNLGSIIANIFVPTMANFGPQSTVVFSGTTTIAGNVSFPNTIIGAFGMSGNLVVGGSILFAQASSTGGLTITDNGTNLLFNFDSHQDANSINLVYTKVAGGQLEIANNGSDIITFTGAKTKFNVLAEFTTTAQFDSELTFSPDNTVDLGNFGGNRPRTIYIGTDLSVKGNFGITGNTIHSGTSLFSGTTTIVNNLLLEMDLYINSGTLHTKSISSPGATIQINNQLDVSGTNIKLPGGSTGTATPSFGSNAPAPIGTLTHPNQWIPFVSSTGGTLWIPAWA